jgi:hypothetical protein
MEPAWKIVMQVFINKKLCGVFKEITTFSCAPLARHPQDDSCLWKSAVL